MLHFTNLLCGYDGITYRKEGCIGIDKWLYSYRDSWKAAGEALDWQLIRMNPAHIELLQNLNLLSKPDEAQKKKPRRPAGSKNTSKKTDSNDTIQPLKRKMGHLAKSKKTKSIDSKSTFLQKDEINQRNRHDQNTREKSRIVYLSG